MNISENNNAPTFLQDLAADVFAKYNESVGEVVLVFPNKRSGLFFKRYLSKLSEKPLWSPEVLSIEEFIESRSSLKKEDPLNLLMILFEEYKKIFSGSDILENFFFWGEILIKDFDDIDKNLVNASQLFINLARYKELGSLDYLENEEKEILERFWKDFEINKSKGRESFIAFWEKLGGLYKSYTTELKKQGIGYQGLIYKDVAEHMAVDQTEREVIFAGFNYLTKSENKIIQQYILSGKGDIYWDFDQYYFNNKAQEAGYFFRQYKNIVIYKRSFQRAVPNYIQDLQREINVIATSSHSSQVRLVGDILNAKIKEGITDWTKTAIIVPDPSLLKNLLWSLPEKIKEINISIGIPVSSTAAYKFVEEFFILINSASVNSEKVYYSKKLLIKFLSNSYSIRIFGAEYVEQVIVQIEKIRAGVVGYDVIVDISKGISEFLTYSNSLEIMIARVEKALVLLDQFLTNPMDLISVNVLLEIIQKIRELERTFSIPLSIAVFEKIIHDIVLNLFWFVIKNFVILITCCFYHLSYCCHLSY